MEILTGISTGNKVHGQTRFGQRVPQRRTETHDVLPGSFCRKGKDGRRNGNLLRDFLGTDLRNSGAIFPIKVCWFDHLARPVIKEIDHIEELTPLFLELYEKDWMTSELPLEEGILLGLTFDLNLNLTYEGKEIFTFSLENYATELEYGDFKLF
jgi:hypothetical protein